MIRFANKKDIDGIMGFIDTHWRKGHILGNNKRFFEYEHLLSEGVSYVLSIDEEKNEINAILGYIPYGKKNRDVMTVMWKSNHNAHASLGLALFQYLKENGDARIMASPGSNPKLKGLYQYLGYSFGKMTQWYRLRPQESYFIANVENRDIPQGNHGGKYVFFASWDELAASFDFEKHAPTAKPYKESWYIRKRYFEHPIYKYDVYGLKEQSGEVRLLMVFRIIEAGNIHIVRLIDCIGDFSFIGISTGLLDDLLEKHSAEYVDCYETGIPDDYLAASGWRKTEGSGNIIPNYFAPFTQSNTDIYYFSTDPDIVLFKGDGDQDRPN